VLSAVNEWSNNNGGQYPANSLALYVAMQNAKLGFYTYTSQTFANVVSYTSSPSGDVNNDTNTETIRVVSNATCKTDANTGANTGAATKANRSLAILYTVESGSGPQAICQSS
jgi:hypothetical protein